MKICMISSESNPFLKIGGLGDVIYSLSRKMVVYKRPTTIVMPFYKNIPVDFKDTNFEKVTSFEVKMAWRNLQCEVLHTCYHDVDFYFIKNDFYFGTREKPYGYKDDQERFAFFQNATMKMLLVLQTNFDIIHIHDWETGMIPLIYQEFYKGKFKKEPKFIFTIHNSAYLGLVDRKDLYDYFNISEFYYDNGLTRFHDKVSYLKTGIMLADRITTVSKTHAIELLNGLDKNGLEDCLKYRQSVFRGIVNGIDTKFWNPDKDEFLSETYSKENAIKGKYSNKIALCKKLGFKNYDYPLFSVVARLTEQKGFDLLIEALPEIIKGKANVFILGTGDKEIESKLAFYASVYPDNFKICLDYDEKLAHNVYAASDFFLMMSKFEPCGITQMLSQRYGTLPIARATGGLVDTIIPYNGVNEENATGILFEQYSKHSLLMAVNIAQSLYKKKRTLTRLIHNVMDVDHSWTGPYQEYYQLYLEACGR